MEEPLVSVITITYNSEKTIESTVKSVIDQDYKNIEYIIIDGQSTDKTLNILDQYRDKIAKIISEKDDGIYDAFNKGIKASTGEFIQIVNSDDIMDKNKISNCVKFMLENPEVDVLNGDLRMFKTEYKNYYEHRTGKNPSYFNKFHMGGLLHPTFFVKKTVYDFALFNKFKIGMDFDWALRVIKKGFIFDTISNNISYMRDDGVSNQDFKTSMYEDYHIAIKNGSNRILAFLFLNYSILKKYIFLLLKLFFPSKILYLFKPNKSVIPKR